MGIPIFKADSSNSNSGSPPTQAESTHSSSSNQGQSQGQSQGQNQPFRALPREEAERMFMEAMEEQYARQEGGA